MPSKAWTTDLRCSSTHSHHLIRRLVLLLTRIPSDGSCMASKPRGQPHLELIPPDDRQDPLAEAAMLPCFHHRRTALTSNLYLQVLSRPIFLLHTHHHKPKTDATMTISSSSEHGLKKSTNSLVGVISSRNDSRLYSPTTLWWNPILQRLKVFVLNPSEWVQEPRCLALKTCSIVTHPDYAFLTFYKSSDATYVSKPLFNLRRNRRDAPMKTIEEWSLLSSCTLELADSLCNPIQ